MRNAQSFEKSTVVRGSDLKRFSHESHGRIRRYDVREAREVVVRGHLSFHRFSEGLSIHSAVVTEQREMRHCFELPAGLSFNFVFSGYVDITLLGGRHRLSAADTIDDAVLCHSFALARPELMTRYMHERMTVTKLNVSVTREWLEQHGGDAADAAFIAGLFTRHARVEHWPVSPALHDAACAWLTRDAGKGVIQRLRREQQAVGLVAQILDEYGAYLKAMDPRPAPSPRQPPQNLKSDVDRCLSSCRTLPEIAARLHMSASALQRRFKRHYALTVSEYVRMRRLEEAKRALLSERVSLTQAAHIAGYRHVSNFIAAFRKQFMTTPAALLKAHS